jgi:hypothetical protein
MESAEQAAAEVPSSNRAIPGLEDLISIALVIGAGCEPCTESMVQQARRRGTPEALIARTLAIGARACSVECLERAVGPEVVGRMRRSLEAGERALRQTHGRARGGGYCSPEA